MATLRLLCPAKLNRYLVILGRREDGYHEVEHVTTVLEGIHELSDVLSAESATRTSLTLGGPFAEGLRPDESNLVLRAWRLLEREATKPLPTELHLEKRIPHGAGLGGGSSDAAAALKLGNELWKLNLSQARLLELAAKLGSDVPLFILGGTVWGRGRGEHVEPLSSLPLPPLLLVYPGFHVTTATVYEALSKVGYPPPPLPLNRDAAIQDLWINQLTEAALEAHPSLASAQRALVEVGGKPLLCGSGSSWIARFDSSEDRDRAFHHLSQTYPQWHCWKIL